MGGPYLFYLGSQWFMSKIPKIPKIQETSALPISVFRFFNVFFGKY
jgi:hypothetical protein